MKNIVLLFRFVTSGALAQLPNYTVPRFLDLNRVKARIHSVNNKFWQIYGNGLNAYEVPKGKGANAQFANSIWIGGLDSQGMLHLSANTYRQTGVDFWPGPLDTSNINSYHSTNSSVYNTLWKVDCNDINDFATAFNNMTIGNTYTIPADFAGYPAWGIANFQKHLAPFTDVLTNGSYNPAGEGDYPVIRG